MKAPIERDLQIEMMKAATERHDALVARWASDKTIKELVRRPSPKQSAYTYSEHDLRLKHCAA